MYIYILHNIYIYIMKTMFPPDYHHNGFVATHALGYIYIYIYIYITPILLLWDLSTLCVLHLRSLTYLCKYI